MLRVTDALEIRSISLTRSQLCAATLRQITRYVAGYSSPKHTLNAPNSQGRYHNWAKSVGLESKLPGDIKKRRREAEEASQTLDRHLKEKKQPDRVVPYSDNLFRQAAIEWLVSTDQV